MSNLVTFHSSIMEQQQLPNLLALLILLPFSAFLLLFLRRRRNSNLPPGPPGWPIFGNMFDLKPMPHRKLASFRQQYGGVIWLRLGAMNTMVILSAKSATEFFKNHDLTFADRTIRETMRVHDYNKSSVALAQYGPYWRVLRRLVTADMLVIKRLTESAPTRRKCVDQLLTWIDDESTRLGEGRGVRVGKFVFLMSFNLLGNLMLSRDVVDPELKETSELFAVVKSLMQWSGHANLSDLFPWLKWADPQGLKRKMVRDLGKTLGIASKFVKERMMDDDDKRDFLEVLINFEGNGKDEPDKFSEQNLTFFILEIFMAGSETTSSTIEWALTELLRHPKSMIKVKAEVAQVIGPNRKVEESDIDNLPFLQAVVKETLRLHPPIPLLVPRKATKSTNFMGYDIPKDTQVLVNAWAIGRDPDVWDDPESFRPERFIGSKVEYKGQNFEFLPFGAGRRMCAGVPLAHRVLNLVMGSLLHQFDWEFEANVDISNVDMRDKMGITVCKLEPLQAVPKKVYP